MYKFGKEADASGAGLDSLITLGQYLRSKNYSEEFIHYFITPMGAAIWSTPANKVLDMPAYFFIKFFYNHGMLEIVNRPKWWVIKNGSSQYIEKLIKGFEDKIHLSSPIVKVSRSTEGVEILLSNMDEKVKFDAVVFATHSDQALNLLEDPTELESEILQAFPYQKNDVMLHTDSSVLPTRKLAWASWNYQLDRDPSAPVVLTYNMNILQSIKAKETFCVTLNDFNSVDESKVIKKITYYHPLFTVDSIKAQKRKHEISGVNNTYYCGAYWRNGFHEDGVVSALDVCKQFGEVL